MTSNRTESVFTDTERRYLTSQRIGRLVTIGRDGTPQVRPVGFTLRGTAIEVGGIDLAATQKYRNVVRNPNVAFIVDDLASVQPWHVRGVEIRGEAQALPRSSVGDALLLIHPLRIICWGLDDDNALHARTVLARNPRRPASPP